MRGARGADNSARGGGPQEKIKGMIQMFTSLAVRLYVNLIDLGENDGRGVAASSTTMVRQVGTGRW